VAGMRSKDLLLLILTGISCVDHYTRKTVSSSYVRTSYVVSTGCAYSHEYSVCVR
jgi:hypothetical protein